MKLEMLTPGVRVAGALSAEAVLVLGAQWHGSDALELTYKTDRGQVGQCVLYRKHENGLSLARQGGRPFDAPANDFQLAAEMQRIQLAGLFHPMLAVSTSDVRPLPHQIRAVYDELLPRTPLRFLLADDPGAGKTIMAGLYIKELKLRDDVKRCLVVAPGGLVEQWQDELYYKFDLSFDILTPELGEASIGGSPLDRYPLLIARMDQLSRNPTLVAQLAETEWDLIVVDEAHRMSARYSGGALQKTKRFQLGELLGGITRHLLLMTATPHSGKPDDFELFLGLLDKDRFEGRPHGRGASDTSGLMRRMVKEDLLTLEGRPLFPERIAETIAYALTAAEQDLYDQVTDYVRNGMNRAEVLGGRRRNTVGFALTVLQRRLASSPEAIHQSLTRRSVRLEARRRAFLLGAPTSDPTTLSWEDPDELSAGEIESIEDELVDSATTAQTVEELTAELADLARLTAAASRVRDSGTDKKWSELQSILQDHALTTDSHGKPRKLIVFTEHRDTLSYLSRRISTLLGSSRAVEIIHGGVQRDERRRVTERFTTDPAVRILLATDAAGEGLNLQAAHLMVNYDLPWNPNRIEQRFGRIHRIGQDEVCRLWNLVASTTREGEVLTTLLNKVEEQRKAYGGKVFDVLGSAFEGSVLRELLTEAIRYGERPDVRANMHRVIDARVADGINELLRDRALASGGMAASQVAEVRRQMDDSVSTDLGSRDIQNAFLAAFTRLGGRAVRRESGRYEIVNVPAAVRGDPVRVVHPRYARVAFDVEEEHGDPATRAALIAPGHPLHDAVVETALARWGGSLQRGTVLVSPRITTPCLLVGIREEIVDATGASVARRFGYAFVDSGGVVTPAGTAPYRGCEAAPEGPSTAQARALPWLADAEAAAVTWIITRRLPAFLADVTTRRSAELARTRLHVDARLDSEIRRLHAGADTARTAERLGRTPQETAASLLRKARDLEDRRDRRLRLLNEQQHMSTPPPVLVSAALVLPQGR